MPDKRIILRFDVVNSFFYGGLTLQKGFLCRLSIPAVSNKQREVRSDTNLQYRNEFESPH
jgi:hypothetical protein